MKTWSGLTTGPASLKSCSSSSRYFCGTTPQTLLRQDPQPPVESWSGFWSTFSVSVCETAAFSQESIADPLPAAVRTGSWQALKNELHAGPDVDQRGVGLGWRPQNQPPPAAPYTALGWCCSDAFKCMLEGQVHRDYVKRNTPWDKTDASFLNSFPSKAEF